MVASFVRSLLIVVLLVTAAGLAASAAAQTGAGAGRLAPEQRTLGERIERRYDVLPLQNGLALRPKDRVRDVRSIELSDGAIAINGAPVTGSELRARVGADADLLLQLSYLEPAARRALFGLAEGTETPAAREEPAPEAATPEAAPAARRPERTRHSGTQMRIGGSVRVETDEAVEDVVVIGGSAHVDGQVDGEVVVIGGVAVLGPHADVRRDVTIVGGVLKRDPGARVGGKVNAIGFGSTGVGIGPLRRGLVLSPFRRGFGLSPFLSLAATLVRLALLCLLVCLVLLVASGLVEKVADHAAAEPWKAGFVGLLAQILFLPVLVVTIVVLAVSIIGIPLLVLLPFAMIGLLVVGLVGFTAVAYGVGRRVERQLGGASEQPYLAALTGLVVLLSPVLLARLVGLGGGILGVASFGLVLIGFLVEYLAWTVGFGAAALARFGSRPGAQA